MQNKKPSQQMSSKLRPLETNNTIRQCEKIRNILQPVLTKFELLIRKLIITNTIMTYVVVSMYLLSIV